jgi:hypothetical protein
MSSKLKIDKQQIIDKWQPVLDSMGITGSKGRLDITICRRYTLTFNATSSNGQTLLGQHTVTYSNQFASVAFPLVKRNHAVNNI